jgi:shikimate dehydrogenase
VTSPTAATRLFAVLGNPVAHSRSPLFQNAAIRAAGIDAIYVALRCSDHDVGPLLRSLARAGGGGNVTVPHKAAAAEAVERRTEAVELTGACNTFWLEDGAVWGDNTDVQGAAAAIDRLLDEAGTGLQRVLLLGAGGAASAALAALIDRGAREITVANRSLPRARSLCERFAGRGASLRASPEADPGQYDVVVNATTVGLAAGDLPPVGAARFRAALDVVYAPGGTTWVRSLRESGIPALDGGEMLLRQGAAAFRRWFGRDPELAVMRAALEAPSR